MLDVGDVILAVGQGDDELVSIYGMKLEDSIKLIKGPAGTVVTLRVKKIDDLSLSSEDLLSLKLSLNNIDTQLILLDDSVQALNNYRNQLNQVILEIQTQISIVQNSLNQDKVVQN